MSAGGVATAPIVEVGAGNALAATRSRVYAELANAFRHPQDALAAERLAEGHIEQALVGLIDGLSSRLPAYAVAPFEERKLDVAAADVDVLYCSLFDGAAGSAPVSLEERDYAASARELLWEDLFRCYAHFGLELEGGGLRETPDHLTIELEFMHFLTFLEASNPETARGVVLGERDFLALHLAAWAPRLCESIAARSNGSVYHRLAHLLRDFVAADREHLESRTSELRRSPDGTHSPV